MTEQNFQAPPPPPKAPTISPMVVAATNDRTASPERSIPQKQKGNFATDLGLPQSILETKPLCIIFGALFLIGILLGGALFGSDSVKPTPKGGLQGVVPNPDIARRMRRCGMTDTTNACLLYIVNHTRYDRLAENFFDEAVKLTGRQRYLISIENPQYAKTKIPPGYFVEIKIPALK